MEAMEIYKTLSQPPKSALREIQAGDLKGKTDINPQWRYKAMTEVFGLVGIGWKYEVQKLWTEPGAKNEVLAFAQVAVFVRDPETKVWSDPIVGIGGSKLINAFSAGLKSNDEGFKMAVTDAFSTSLKMLGVAADIYAGAWDGSKYKMEEPATKPAAPKPKVALKGGDSTPDETAQIKRLFDSKYPDGNPVFTKDEARKYVEMRKDKTASEVIALVKAEFVDRLNKADEAKVAIY